MSAVPIEPDLDCENEPKGAESAPFVYVIEDPELQLPGTDIKAEDRFARADSLLQYISEVDPAWIESMLKPTIVNLKFVHHNRPKPYLKMAWGDLRLKLANYLDPFDLEEFSYKTDEKSNSTVQEHSTDC